MTWYLYKNDLNDENKLKKNKWPGGLLQHLMVLIMNNTSYYEIIVYINDFFMVL